MRLTCLLSIVCLFASAQHKVNSPDQQIEVVVQGGKELTIAAKYRETTIINPSPIGLTIRGADITGKVKKLSLVEKDETIISPVPEKRRSIRDHFRQLELS